MAFYERLIERLFPKNEEISIHEVLKRSNQFNRSFDKWKSSDEAGKELGMIRDSYYDKVLNKITAIDLEVYHSPYANGIILYPQYEQGKISLTFIMEFIREKLELDNYRLVHADRKIKEQGKMVTALEKYYLKPPLSAEIPIDQKFGNVILELSYENNSPWKLKMMANVYSDRLYNQPKPFDDLISLIFGERKSD
jgi:hypothetical protein